jgi:hypothetical protein
MFRRTLQTIAPVLTFSIMSACAEEPGSVPEVPAEEISPQVAELDAIHEVMVPMWHEAFPARDIAGIQAAVPQFQPLVEGLDAATLPGILQDKQEQWDGAKARLMESFQGLKSAADAADEDAMLGAAEAFHMSYEAMVRIIRPVVPELDAFHRHLYGVYHYYSPGFDVEKIREGANSMAAAIPPLQAAQLPSNLEDRRADFEARVIQLGDRVATLLIVLENPNRAEVGEAVEAVHTAYQSVEEIFD